MSYTGVSSVVVTSERTAPPSPGSPPTPSQKPPPEPLPGELTQVEAGGNVRSWLAFGDNGITAHATAWGGLLQVRTYFPQRKSVTVAELGETVSYNFRERLKRVNALSDAIPGLGLYPDLSDDAPIRQPVQWLFNRWPCISYDSEYFHITVQLCISQGFVVQKYSIDNRSSDERNIVFNFNPGIVLRSEGLGDADYDPKNNVVFADEEGHYTVRNTVCGAGFKFSLYHNEASLPLATEFGTPNMDSMTARRRRRLERRMRMRSSFSGYGYGLPSILNAYGVSSARSPTGCPSPLLGERFRIPITTAPGDTHEITAVYSLLELDETQLTSFTTNAEKIGDPLPYIPFDDILHGERRRRHLVENEHIGIPDYDDDDTTGHPIYVNKWPKSLFLRHLEYVLSVCAVPIIATAGGTVDTDAGKDDEDHAQSKPCPEKSPNSFTDHGLAFVELFPAASSTSGFSGFFAFRFLLSMYLFLRRHTATTDTATRAYYQERIKNACTAHLKWVFETAKVEDGSWAATYLPNGEDTLGSSFTAGSLNHLKLYEFLKVFPDQEDLVLNCMKRRTPGWLDSLVKTRHKGKFWFDHTIELNIEFRDLDFREGYTLEAPKYKLTGLCLLWWALRSLDEIVTALTLRETRPDFTRQIQKALVSLDFFDMRERVLDAFTVDTDPERAEPHRARPETQNPAGADNDFQPRPRQTDTKRKTLVFSQRVLKEELRAICYCNDSFLFEAVAAGFFQDETGKERPVWTEAVTRQTSVDVGEWDRMQRYSLALTMLKHCQSIDPGERDRKLEQCRLVLRSAIFESGGIATKLDPGAGPSRDFVDTVGPFQIPVILLWDECEECSPLSLKLQKREGPSTADAGDVSDRDDAVSVAATDREPQTQPQAPRRTLVPPMKVMTRKKLTVRNVNFDRKRINISPEVSRDWLYDYPDFIHFAPLVYDVREVSEELHPVGLFDEDVLPELLEMGSDEHGNDNDDNDDGINSDDDDDNDVGDARATIVDCGMKRNPLTKRLGLGKLQSYLKKPRVPELAKKRLCYLDECTPTIAFAMCLGAPQSERQHLATFFFRHSQGSIFYQEWLHTLANIWESEFHLQFFQIVGSADVGKKDRGWILCVDEQEFPDPGKTGRRYIVQAATGYRFVGDLHDRFWTCHIVASVVKPSDKWITKSAEHEGLLDTQDRHDQRNVFESYLIEKITEEACQSGDEILDEIDAMLDSNFGAAHVHNGDFESRYSLTSTFLQTSAILRKLQGNYDSMIKAIAQWDRRQVERTTQPRWTEKDELRCSERIAYPARRGKRNANRLKAHKERIDSLLNFTTTQREAILGDLQLEEARRSTRLSQDVRLFTYVTIVFLPLSFSSSLFSMGGRPDNHTIVIMVWTTVVALAITFFLLANMKLVDRQARIIFRGFERSARRRMKHGGVAWPVDWRNIATQLETAAQQSLQYEVQSDTADKSAWWVIIFWVLSLITIPAMVVSYAIADAAVGAKTGVRFGLRIVRLLLALFFLPLLVMIYIGQCVVQLPLEIFRVSCSRGDLYREASNGTESTASGDGKNNDKPTNGGAVATENIYYAKQREIFQIISDPSIALIHIAYALHLDSLPKAVQSVASKIAGFFKLMPPPSPPGSVEYSSYFTDTGTTITVSERGSVRSVERDEAEVIEVPDNNNPDARNEAEEPGAPRDRSPAGILAAIQRHRRAPTPERRSAQIEVMEAHERDNSDARRGDEESGARRGVGQGGILVAIERYRRSIRGFFPKKPELEED